MNKQRVDEDLELQHIKRVSLADKLAYTRDYLNKQIDAFQEFDKHSTSAVMHYAQLKAMSETLNQLWDDFLSIDNQRINLIEKLSSELFDNDEDKIIEGD